MNRLQQIAILSELVQKLRDQGSWCGETHIQKSVYFLENLFKEPILGFEFVLYRHGPFSFDLRDELTSMRADGFLELEPQEPPYGPRISPTPSAIQFKALYPKTLNKYQKKLEFIMEKLGDKKVNDLEKLSTALFVNKQEGTDTSEKKRAEEIHDLKPHISVADALDAIRKIDAIQEEAKHVES
jgi:uncharacterized protein YwgA